MIKKVWSNRIILMVVSTTIGVGFGVWHRHQVISNPPPKASAPQPPAKSPVFIDTQVVGHWVAHWNNAEDTYVFRSDATGTMTTKWTGKNSNNRPIDSVDVVPISWRIDPDNTDPTSNTVIDITYSSTGDTYRYTKMSPYVLDPVDSSMSRMYKR